MTSFDLDFVWQTSACCCFSYKRQPVVVFHTNVSLLLFFIQTSACCCFSYKRQPVVVFHTNVSLLLFFIQMSVCCCFSYKRQPVVVFQTNFNLLLFFIQTSACLIFHTNVSLFYLIFRMYWKIYRRTLMMRKLSYFTISPSRKIRIPRNVRDRLSLLNWSGTNVKWWKEKRSAMWPCFYTRHRNRIRREKKGKNESSENKVQKNNCKKIFSTCIIMTNI